jgi:UDP-GlcNAc:undecaprenyl-phosphate GlcNAc-1-phosphate transferase
MNNLFFYALSCALTVLFVALLHKPAQRFRLLDIPNGRKNHSGEVPLTGGLAMFFAFAAAALMQGGLPAAYAALFIALAVLVATGVCDDLFDLSAGSRFVAQAAAALLMAFAGKVALTDLGNLFGGGAVLLEAASVPFTVFCVVGVINAVNMLDGVDGLAGGVVFFVLALFGGSAWLSGNETQAGLLFALAGAVAGFAALNMRSPWRPRAAVFMGDSGSMMLGFVVAWFAIDLSQQPSKAFAPITAVWILALPLLDTVSLMIRRAMKGRSPFAPDHDHLHHVFLRAGFSVRQTVALIVLGSLLLGLAGIAAWRCGVPDAVMCYAFLLLFAAYFLGMQHAWRLMRILRGIHDFKFG